MNGRRTLDETFAILVAAAVKGERCPLSNWERLPFQEQGEPPTALVCSNQLQKLARAGRIVIEVSGRNYRTVTILVGPHAGKKTAPDPKDGRIWQTIGVTRTLNTSVTRRPEPRGPSAPRMIGRGVR